MKNFKRDYVLDQESSFCTLQPKKDTCKGEEFKEVKLVHARKIERVASIQIPHLLIGDSGGPLAEKRGSQYVLVGIISWGSDKCAQPGHQDVSFYSFTERLEGAAQRDCASIQQVLFICTILSILVLAV